MGNYSEIVFKEVFLKAHDEFMAHHQSLSWT